MADIQADLALDLSAAFRDVDRLEAKLGRATSDVDIEGFGGASDDVDDLTRGLDQAGKEADELDAGARRFKGAIIAAGAALVAAGLTKGLKAAVSAASDLEESTSKAATVFGDEFSRIEQFASGAATNLGLANDEALEATGTFGNLLTAMGQSQEAAAEMSTNMVQLAADLASFNNIPIEEALNSLRSGIVGEVEPMRRLGVAIDAAAIEAKALELGIADLGEELDQGQKIQARYAVIMEQTSTAQGDIARTSESFANQQRFLTAEIRNAAAEIGTQLLPAATELLGTARDEIVPTLSQLAMDVLPTLTAAFDALQPLLGGTLTILDALSPVIEGVGLVLEALPDDVVALGAVLITLNRTMGVTATRARGMMAAITPLKATLGLAAGAVLLFANQQQKARQFAEELRATLDQQTGAVTENTRTFAANALQKEGAFDAARALGLSIQTVTDAAVGEADALQRVNDAVAAAGPDLADAVKQTSDFGEAQETAAGAAFILEKALGIVEPEVRRQGEAVREIAEATGEAEDATLDLERVFPLLGAAARAAGGDLDDTEEEVVQLTDAQKALSSVLQQFVTPMDTYSTLLSDKEAAEKEAAQATADATESGEDSWEDFVGDVTVSLDEYAAALEEQVADLQEWETNLQIIGHRTSDEFAQQLAELGPEASGLVADMATATDAELQRLVPLFGERARLASDEAAIEFEAGLSQLPVTMVALGQGTMAGFAEGIIAGMSEAAIAAHRAARSVEDEFRSVLESTSPSQVFVDIGRDTIQGYIIGLDSKEDDLIATIEGLVGRAVSGAGDVLSAIGVVQSVEEAQAELAALEAERATLPADIAAAERQLQEARREAAEVTLAEEEAILRAKEQVRRAESERAQTRLQDASPEERRLADIRLAQAQEAVVEARRAAVGATREVEDAERDLADLRERRAEIDGEIEDQTLRVVRAQQRLVETGQDLIGQGPEAEATFRAIAESAGLTTDQIDALVESYGRLDDVTAGLVESGAAAEAAGVASAILSSPEVRRAVEATGHAPGGITDPEDVREALRRIGHDAGGRIDVGDLQVLVDFEFTDDFQPVPVTTPTPVTGPRPDAGGRQAQPQPVIVNVQGDVNRPLDEERIATLVRRSRQMAGG